MVVGIVVVVVFVVVFLLVVVVVVVTVAITVVAVIVADAVLLALLHFLIYFEGFLVPLECTHQDSISDAELFNCFVRGSLAGCGLVVRLFVSLVLLTFEIC